MLCYQPSTILAHERKSTTAMQEPFFKPWVGENYNSQTPKILVLGESHYASPDEYKSSFTREVIEKCAVNAGKGRLPYFTKIAQILLNKQTYEVIDAVSRKALWGRIAFYNYVQNFVGGKSRIRPTSEMWTKAEEALKYVLDDLQPDIVIVTGIALAYHIKPVTDSYTGSAKFCYWTHPSAPSFSKDRELATQKYKVVTEQYAG